MKVVKNEDRELYQCEECGFRYAEKEWAEKCEAWCREHKSCNIEIAAHAFPQLEIAVLGGGCFGCTEAVFLQLKGVGSVVSGYAGGSVLNPTYDQVSGGKTGHAEVIKIEYDPAVIQFHKLLEVFFASHDPTTPDRQGPDVGSQYRSILLYTTKQQREEAERHIKELTAAGKYGRPIVTEIAPLTAFYPAEEYHQRYYERNPNVPYAEAVIKPKVEKVKKEFGDSSL